MNISLLWRVCMNIILGGILFDWRPAAPYLLAAGVSVAVSFLAVFRDADGCHTPKRDT